MPDAGRVLVIDSDPLTQSMLAEWLDGDGWHVLEPVAGEMPAGITLIVLDLAFPRSQAPDALVAIRRAHPGVPVIVISPTVFANVGCCGPCAELLEVGGVLPKPVSRDALIRAARRWADGPRRGASSAAAA